jgi:hypothetical protein
MISGILTYNFGYKKIYITEKTGGKVIQDPTLSDLSSEYQEVEQYYKSNVDSKLNELDRLKCSTGETEKKSIVNEVNKLDQMYQFLRKELKSNTYNERVINAMIINYQKRLEILDQVILKIRGNC